MAMFGAGGLTPATPEVLHPSGITILQVPPAVPDPLPDDLATALGRADAMSEQFPADFGYPLVDRAHGRVILTVTSAQGQSMAEAVRAGDPAIFEIRSVRHSRESLQDVLDRAIGPSPEGPMVISDYPDPASNRVILEVTEAPDAFLYGLAARFDPSAIAVLVIGDQPLTYPA